MNLIINNDVIAKKINSKLPRDIDFKVVNKVLTVRVNKPCSNMQTNESAFESWIIMLKSHLDCNIDKVILDFNTEIKDEHQLHFNRFLWRVSNFKEMYSWFEVDNTKEYIINEFLIQTFIDLKVNMPSKQRTEVVNSKGERYIEWLFVEKQPNILCERLNCDNIFNQFPVGIFKQKVSKNTAIFTGKSSAIDLLGIEKGKDILHLIELKKDKNSSIGIISEFLFYAFILHNIFIDKNIKYEEDKTNIFEFEELCNMNIKKITGHLLAEKFHRLIDDKTIALLNEGLKKINIEIDMITYLYDKDNGVELK